MTSTAVDSRSSDPTRDELLSGHRISAVVEQLIRWHRLNKDDVAAMLGLGRSTFYDRLRDGDWRTAEVDILAYYFGRPVEEFFSGKPLPHESLLAQHPIRLSREPETAGQGRFSGSDIDRFIDAADAASNYAVVA